jgi:hypothetical protein
MVREDESGSVNRIVQLTSREKEPKHLSEAVQTPPAALEKKRPAFRFQSASAGGRRSYSWPIGSTSVFSVIGRLQFGQRSASVNINS